MSDFVGQVIYVESLRYRGRWLDAHHFGKCRFTDAPELDVIDADWAKWIVREGPKGTIALESIRYRNYFLDAHHSRICRETYCVYPNKFNWALWFLEKTPSDNFCLRSSRYTDSRLDANDSGKAHVTAGSGKWSEMRIYQPDIIEKRMLIYSLDNSTGTTPVEASYTEKHGISRTKSTKLNVSANMSMEIEKIFSAKASLSSTWEQSDSTTWSSENSKTIKVSVNPGTIKKIFQLHGFYGPYTVASNQFFIEG